MSTSGVPYGSAIKTLPMSSTARSIGPSMRELVNTERSAFEVESIFSTARAYGAPIWSFEAT
ncbi:hypothetical protein D3C87_2136240 [compost metagenome]